MATYVAPQLIQYGNSREVIKGDCSWGGELPWFDESGMYEYYELFCNEEGYCVNGNEICASSPPNNECGSGGDGTRC